MPFLLSSLYTSLDGTAGHLLPVRGRNLLTNNLRFFYCVPIERLAVLKVLKFPLCFPTLEFIFYSKSHTSAWFPLCHLYLSESDKCMMLCQVIVQTIGSSICS